MFDDFVENVHRQFSDFMKNESDNNITIFNVNEIGNRVVPCMAFMRVVRQFGSIKFLRAEKLGYAQLGLLNRRLVYTWTEVRNIIRVVNEHTITTNDFFRAAIT